MTFKQITHHLNRRDFHLLPKINFLTKFSLIFIVIIGSVFLTKNILAFDLEIPAGGVGDATANINREEFVKKYLEKQEAVETGNNQESWIEESLMSNTVSMNKAVSGTLNEKSFTSAWIPGGMIGVTNNFIASLYNPPASGIQYIAHTINNFMGKPTYAANGFGFGQLNAVLSIWKTIRNAVYTLVSLVFIIFGIMIMLRIKISPQATISIQVIIPKIIITLIFVTFSYAIAGLIIDLSYVVEGVILSTVMSNPEKVGQLMQLNYQGIHDLIFIKILPYDVSVKLGELIGGAIGGTMGGLTGWAGRQIGNFAGFLIFLLMSLFAFIHFIKLFFGLAMCYVKIIIKIIIAPLEIGLGVFPGSKTGFSSWIFDLIANISVFPSVTIFLVVASWLVPQLSKDDVNLWSPNLLGSGQVIGGLIGMVSILLLSKIPKIVPEAIFKIKPSPYGNDLGKDFSKTPGLGLAAGAWGLTKTGITGGLTKNIGERVKFMKEDTKKVNAGTPQPTINKYYLVRGSKGKPTPST